MKRGCWVPGNWSYKLLRATRQVMVLSRRKKQQATSPVPKVTSLTGSLRTSTFTVLCLFLPGTDIFQDFLMSSVIDGRAIQGPQQWGVGKKDRGHSTSVTGSKEPHSDRGEPNTLTAPLPGRASRGFSPSQPFTCVSLATRS